MKIKTVDKKVFEILIIELNQVVDALEDQKLPIDELIGFATWRIEQVIGQLMPYVKEEK